MSDGRPGGSGGPGGSGRVDGGGPVAGLEWVDLDASRVVPVRRLVPGAAAMTLDRWVLVRRDRLEDAVLLAHELVHVRQWRERGRWRFALRYLADYLRGRARGLSHREAYRAVPAEVEARRVASAVERGPVRRAGPPGGLA